MKGWKCSNCGHIHVATDSLEELGFEWLLDETVNRTRCIQCKSYVLARPYSFDHYGIPYAGEFLFVKSHIRKGKK